MVRRPVAREELENEEWLLLMAQFSNRGCEPVRVAILEFLDTDILQRAGGKLRLIPRSDHRLKRFEFAEQECPQAAIEPGLKQFLKDRSLSGDVTEEEIAFLKALHLRGKRPSPIYYYRELQNLRDPLHFLSVAQPGEE